MFARVRRRKLDSINGRFVMSLHDVEKLRMVFFANDAMGSFVSFAAMNCFEQILLLHSIKSRQFFEKCR